MIRRHDEGMNIKGDLDAENVGSLMLTVLTEVLERLNLI